MPGEGFSWRRGNPSVCDMQLKLWRVEAGLVGGRKDSGDHTDHFLSESRRDSGV